MGSHSAQQVLWGGTLPYHSSFCIFLSVAQRNKSISLSSLDPSPSHTTHCPSTCTHMYASLGNAVICLSSSTFSPSPPSPSSPSCFPFPTILIPKWLPSRLSSNNPGMHCTCHRVFLATLIVAAKYLNDQSPKNKHWSAHSSVFSVGEVNLMEKQLLSLLDFDLRITEADLASSLQDFLQAQQASASVTPSDNTTRYSSPIQKPAPSSSIPSPTSSYISQALPLNQPSSNKRASTTRQDLAITASTAKPHEYYRRRPSLPNQPDLEEGEVMPVYKGPIRGHQDQYPSPDGGPDALAAPSYDDEMSPASSSSHQRSYTPDGYGAAQKAWMASTGAMYSSAPNLRVSMMYHPVVGEEREEAPKRWGSRAMC